MSDLTGRRILIVEDEILIALMLQDILEELGWVVVATATRSGEALDFLRANSEAIDAAMLDINLGETTSHEIAAVLSAQDIPFVVTTGYTNAPHLVGFQWRPRVQKPYTPYDVRSALECL